VADIGEEETFVDGDVDGVLVGGGVGGALVRVPFPAHVRITAILLVVSLLLLLPLLVFVLVTFTRNWTFIYEMTGLTTSVAHPLGAGLVVFSCPLLEDLAEAFDDERNFLVVKLGGVDWKSAWCRLLSHPVLEGKPNANHVRARISYSRTQQLHNMDIITQCSK
jgi:hypothetical protein